MGTGTLTSTGLDPKRLVDIVTDLEADFRTQFGQSVELGADTEFGKLVSIMADRELLLWERLQEDYDAHYPASATGISLDRVCEITAITRNPALRSTVDLYCRGAAVTIPQQSLVETTDTGVQFRTTVDLVLPAAHTLADIAEGAGNDLVQAAGTATVTYPTHGFLVGEFIWILGCDQTEYNGLKTILTVADANTFTFAVDSGAVSPATGTVSGQESFKVAAESVNTGAIVALAGLLTVIDTPLSGWDAATTIVDAVLGNDEETDATLRTRRIAALQGLGNATMEAIRGALQAVTNVTSALLFVNDSDLTVSSRPPHSFEAVVEGGTAQDVVDSIFANKAAGIATHGSSSGTATDSQGNSHTINYSRPTVIDIYLDITLTVNADYDTVDGDTDVETAVLAWAAANLSIGDDVVVHPYLQGSIIGIPGITDVVIDIGIAATPSGDANIAIAETEVAEFDSTRTTVSS